MNGNIVRIQPRVHEQQKRFATRDLAHFAILLKHREFLWP